MSFFTSVKPVQDWLEDTKLSIVMPLEEGIETLAFNRVLGVLAKRYDTSTWIDDTTSPALVTTAIGMLYAAAYYRRQYSEDLDASPVWPLWLEKTADELVNQIASGGIDLLDVEEVNTGLQSPVFFPTDVATDADPTDPDYAPRLFGIGTVF